MDYSNYVTYYAIIIGFFFNYIFTVTPTYLLTFGFANIVSERLANWMDGNVKMICGIINIIPIFIFWQEYKLISLIVLDITSSIEFINHESVDVIMSAPDILKQKSSALFVLSHILSFVYITAVILIFFVFGGITWASMSRLIIPLIFVALMYVIYYAYIIGYKAIFTAFCTVILKHFI